MNYTGLNKDMYRATVAKIKYQLTSQGFNHIADLSEQGDRLFYARYDPHRLARLAGA